MPTFKKLQENSNIHELIKATFETDLALAGSWGYTKEKSTIIEALPKGMPLAQLEHMVTSIRAHLEMNITQEQESRYGGINANEKAREESKNDTGIFNKVTYEITAMKEDIYTAFIKEYKEGYGKEDFDLSDHFKRREGATLTREVVHYFEVSHIQ
jgi:hypothetical protein